MEFDAVFTVQKERNRDEFLRELLIALANSSKTPVDVVEAEFGEVEECVREAIVCSAHVEMDYSASIGYDHQETYWSKEKKYNSSTNQYYYVDVEKTRTVTDWRPFSGHIAGDKIACVFNEEHASMTNDLVVDVILSIKDSSIVAGGEATLIYAGLEEAKKACARFLESEIVYPGDHHKDTKTHACVTVANLSCYKLPYYEVEYTYNGENYTAFGFACGNSNIHAQLPPNDVNVKEEARQKTKKSEKVKNGLWIGFLGTFILACIMCYFGAPWVGILPIAVLIAAICFNVKYNNKYNGILRSLTTEISVSKMIELGKALKAHSFDSLSTDEEKAFISGAALDNMKYESTYKKSSVKTKAVWASIAVAILALVCCISGIKQVDAALHSPKYLEIEIVAKSEEYKPYVSPYINGCYYIYFDYEVKTKKVGISDMSVVTHVYDKSTGKELGYLTTSFSSMSLEEGATKTYSTEWNDNQPQKNNNTFFLTVYDMNLEDLEFVCEFDYIHFVDGKYYRGDLD